MDVFVGAIDQSATDIVNKTVQESKGNVNARREFRPESTLYPITAPCNVATTAAVGLCNAFMAKPTSAPPGIQS